MNVQELEQMWSGLVGLENHINWNNQLFVHIQNAVHKEKLLSSLYWTDVLFVT